MLTERQAIQEAIQWNRDEISRMREESRVLFEQNFLHTKRLRELDELDRTRGQFIALDSNEIIRLLVEQSRLMAELIDERTPKVDLMAELEPLYSEETTTTTKRTMVETSEESTTTIKRKRNDFKKQSATVASILKDVGRPTVLKDIMSTMEEDHEITWDFPTNAMDLIMKHEPRISRVSHGAYQYKL